MNVNFCTRIIILRHKYTLNRFFARKICISWLFFIIRTLGVWKALTLFLTFILWKKIFIQNHRKCVSKNSQQALRSLLILPSTPVRLLRLMVWHIHSYILKSLLHLTPTILEKNVSSVLVPSTDSMLVWQKNPNPSSNMFFPLLFARGFFMFTEKRRKNQEVKCYVLIVILSWIEYLIEVFLRKRDTTIGCYYDQKFSQKLMKNRGSQRESL